MYAIVLDFDGPIFDGRRAAREALAATMKTFESVHPVPDFWFDHIPLLRPRSLICLVYSGLKLSIEELDRIEKNYREELGAREEALGIAKEIRDLLIELNQAARKLALLSSRRQEDLLKKLRDHDLDKVFERVHGRDSMPNPKPDPAALEQIATDLHVGTGNLIFVGDSDVDYDCAAAAKVLYYHASWSGEPCVQAAAKAAAVLKSPADLREALTFTIPSRLPAPTLTLPAELREAIAAGDLCIYVGAGASVPSKLGAWDDHYLPILRELGVGHLASTGLEMTELVQLVATQRDLCPRLFDKFKKSFDRPDLEPNAYHYAILRARANRIWTSNYDSFFETANARCGLGHRIVTDDRALLENYRYGRLIIKMNGDFIDASYSDGLAWNVIFTQEQFDLIERTRPEIWRLFEDDYRNRCILFVGVSFKDPALRRVVTIARQKVPRTRYSHFILARQQTDPLQAMRHTMFADSLRRQSIETVILKTYEDIIQFVEETAVLSTRPVIGFTGSFVPIPESPAAAGGTEVPAPVQHTPLDKNQVTQLGSHLGKALAERGYRVTSGCAPVVGIPPVSAAFAVNPKAARFYIRMKGGSTFDSTAPAIVVPDEPPQKSPYDAMRKRYVSELSLMIAIGGKPGKDGQRSGTLDEIDVAIEKQIPILLIPQAAGAVEAHREEYLRRIDRSYADPAIAADLRKLNEDVAAFTPAELLDAARHKLPVMIHELMTHLMGSSVRIGLRDGESTQW